MAHKQGNNNICQMQYKCCQKYNKNKSVHKIVGHTNTMTASSVGNDEVNIFCRPEEAMLETGKSLSLYKI